MTYYPRLIGATETTDRCEAVFNQLKDSSNYDNLVEEVEEYNRNNKWKKKGISIQSMRYPHDVQYHISSVQISVLKKDGSVQATVAGIDMGQGMHTRCAQIISNNLGCSLESIFMKSASTEVNANSAPTGGTITTHVQMLYLNIASDNLKKRMIQEATKSGTDASSTGEMPWKELVAACSNIDLHERYQGQFSGNSI